MNAISNPAIYSSWPLPAQFARPLGDNREAARRLYFIDFPLLLLIVGLLGWILPTDRMLVVSAFVATVVALYSLWELVIRQGPIRITHAMCIANTVGYGFGALNSWISIQRGRMATMAATFVILAVLFNSPITEVGLWVHFHVLRDGLLFSALMWGLTKLPRIELREPISRRAVLP